MSKQASISVENLSKVYEITHRADRRRYVALRDVIAEKSRGLFQLRGRKTDNRCRKEDFWALRKVNFEVKQGDVIGIIGRNGAGKSTLLKVLSRITEPSEGRLRIKGRVASLLEVGTGFHPELTGRENIYLNGAILGMRRAETKRKFDEIVAFAAVERFLDTPVKHYSSGMYVRLAFAVAAHLDPDILVIDEVLAVGDAEFQEKCLGKVQESATKHGRTVLFVSHNMSAIRSLCSKAILLDAGRVVLYDQVDSVIQSYLASTTQSGDSVWRCPPEPRPEPVYFRQIRARICGSQPLPQMIVDCEVVCQQSVSRKSSVSVDLSDFLGAPLMQAIPSDTPFISLNKGTTLLQIKVDLPGLVPGRFLVDVWIGTHNLETLAYVSKAVSIMIDESPIPNRTFPHHPDHGFMIAPSSCKYQPANDPGNWISGEIVSYASHRSRSD